MSANYACFGIPGGVAIGDNKVITEIGSIATIKPLYTSKLICVWQMWQYD